MDGSLELHPLNSRDADYADLPEPPPQYAPTGLTDPYLGGLERYIFALGDYIRKIQEEEAQIMNQFSTRLTKLKGKPTRNRIEAEEEARIAFEQDIEKIRSQRRLFRSMKHDAIKERQRLLDSLALQKEDEELLRQKLFKIKALPDEELVEGHSRALFEPLGFILGFVQLILVLVFAFVVEFPDYNYPVSATALPQSSAPVEGLSQGFRGYLERVDDWYSFYIGIALMVFVGFGFLGAYMKKYAFSSIGYSVLLAAICFQWTILADGLWWNVDRYAHRKDTGSTYDGFVRIRLTFDVVINGLYGAAAALVSMGVLYGLARPIELIFVALCEVTFYSLNKYICEHALQALDPGGSMLIHVFGAYFGIASSLFIARPYVTALKEEYKRRTPDELTSSHSSDLLALIGSLVLFVFFPSFNAAMAPNGTQYRAVINTILALMSGCIVVFVVSRTFRRGLFDIRDVQHCIQAAGIAMGSIHSILIQPGGAMLVGAVAAAVSVIGFVWVQPWLEQRSPIKVVDSRGVHNVHGLPGIIGALGGVVAASISQSVVFGQNLSAFVPHARNPGGVQAAAFACSFGIALLSGFFVGVIVWAGRVLLPISANWYSDEDEWVVPADFERKREPLPQ